MVLTVVAAVPLLALLVHFLLLARPLRLVMNKSVLTSGKIFAVESGCLNHVERALFMMFMS